MKTLRRSFTCKTLACSALVGWLICVQAAAADFPNRPLKMLAPSAAGASPDITSRIVGDAMGKQLGQPVVIDNRPGAGGSIASELTARSAPDGYTLTMGTVGTLAINSTLYRNLPYDPSTAFTPIAFVGYTPTLLIVRSDAPYKSVQELVEYARAHVNKLSYASAGNGTSGHIAGELLKRLGNLQVTHVPYKDGAQGVTAMLSGDVDFMFYHPVAVMPYVKDGRLRALAVSSGRRSLSAPGVPTMAESGFKEFDLTAWYMLVAPKGLGADITATLRRAARNALASSEVAQLLASQGVEPMAIADDALQAFIDSEISKWGILVKAANAQVD